VPFDPIVRQVSSAANAQTRRHARARVPQLVFDLGGDGVVPGGALA